MNIIHWNLVELERDRERKRGRGIEGRLITDRCTDDNIERDVWGR